jgi:hypothetical protein
MTEAPVSPVTSWPRPTTTKGGRAVTTTLTAYHLEAADWLALAQLDDDGAPPGRDEPVARQAPGPDTAAFGRAGTTPPLMPAAWLRFPGSSAFTRAL